MLAKLSLAFICLLTGFFSSSCMFAEVEKWPAYADAVAMPAAESPKVFFIEGVDLSSLPAAVPFAAVHVRCTEAFSRAELAKAARRKALPFKPDFLLIGPNEVFQSGYVWSGGLYGGLAVPTHSARLTAACYRRLPARLGIVCNEASMVMTLAEDLRTCGIQEGDTIVSLAGAVYDRKPTSALNKRMLEIQPGEAVELVWIRPGTGRMSGTVTAQANFLLDPSLPDSIDLEGSHATPPYNWPQKRVSDSEAPR